MTSASKNVVDLPRGKSVYRANPDKLIIVGVDTAHGEGEHHLWTHDAFLPLVEEMVMNIMAIGVKKPILVEPGENKEALVVDGRTRVLHAREANRRLRAMGQPEIEVACIVERMTEEEAMMAMSSLNQFARQDSQTVKIQKANAMLNRGVAPEKVALAFGVKVTTIENWRRMLNLPADVADLYNSGAVTASGALALAKKSEEERALIVASAERLVEVEEEPTPEEASPDDTATAPDADPVDSKPLRLPKKKRGKKAKAEKKPKRITVAKAAGVRGKKFYKQFTTDFESFLPAEFLLGVRFAHGLIEDDALPKGIHTQLQGMRAIVGEIDPETLGIGIQRQLKKMYNAAE